MTTSHTKIALVLNKEMARCRPILHGVLEYSHQRPGWVMHTIASLSPSRLELLKNWGPDGVIADVFSKEDEATLAELGLPVVAVSNVLEHCQFPVVTMDDATAGASVARHFLDRGLREFAFFGPEDRKDVRLQREAFARTAEAAGAKVNPQPPIPPMGSTAQWSQLDGTLSTWLTTVPKPLGLMLWDDDWGMWITQLCRLAGVKVPDEVAIVGMHDDAINCELADPPLSSVPTPRQRVGFEAARLLDEMMSGKSAPTEPILVPSQQVTVRPSSDVLAIPDLDLVAAVRFIRDMAHKKIGVDDILSAVPVSRRHLERKFRELLGRSPLQEIRHTRVERARHLLAETDAALNDIANRTGFDNVYHLCRTFKQHTEMTPMAYRRQFRMR